MMALRGGLTLLGTIGVQEMIVIFLVALVLFGPKKLPELGKTIGKALTEFRRASTDLKATFEREMNNLERETESLKNHTESAVNTVYQHSPFDDHEGYLPPAPLHELTAHEPSTVSATEVPGAESHGTLPTTMVAEPEVVAQVEGTVARSSSPAAQPEVHVEPGTQHS
jgi:sec-independent protein translocase protein TatA